MNPGLLSPPATRLSKFVLWMLWLGSGAVATAAIVLIARGSPLGWVFLLNELGGAAGLAARTVYLDRPTARRYLELSFMALAVASAIVLVIVLLNLFQPGADIHLRNDPAA